MRPVMEQVRLQVQTQVENRWESDHENRDCGDHPPNDHGCELVGDEVAHPFHHRERRCPEEPQSLRPLRQTQAR